MYEQMGLDTQQATPKYNSKKMHYIGFPELKPPQFPYYILSIQV